MRLFKQVFLRFLGPANEDLRGSVLNHRPLDQGRGAPPSGQQPFCR